MDLKIIMGKLHIEIKVFINFYPIIVINLKDKIFLY